MLVGTGTSCSNTLEAAEVLSARPDKFDIVLAEVRKGDSVTGVDCLVLLCTRHADNSCRL